MVSMRWMGWVLGLSMVVGMAALVSLPMSIQGCKTAEAPQAKLNRLIAQYTRLLQQKQVPQAIMVAKQALAAAEQMPGQDVQIAQILNDAGYLYQSQNNSAKAAPLHQRALALRERAFRSDGPTVVQSLNNLTQAYRGLGRYAEAASLMKRSVEIVERDVPPDHPAVRTVLERYAETLRESGQAKEAKAIEARLAALPQANTVEQPQETR